MLIQTKLEQIEIFMGLQLEYLDKIKIKNILKCQLKSILVVLHHDIYRYTILYIVCVIQRKRDFIKFD